MNDAPATGEASLLLVRDAHRIAIAPRLLLAPMEGVTDPVFRDHVIAENRLGGISCVGAACTEFIRVTVAPVPVAVVRRYLGPLRRDLPIAVQLMAAVPDHVAASAAHAERAGAAWIDLNFGCPAPTVVGHCAGSALLAHPDRLAAIITAARAGTSLPVSAKLRVGLGDAVLLRDNLQAAAGAGAALITLHGRRRCDPYTVPARWDWIADGVAALAGSGVPLIGNGSVEAPADAARLRAQTHCAGVMIGRGAIADPWIFRQAIGGPAPTPSEAVAFAIHYHAAIAALRPQQALPRLKQLLRWYRAGGLFSDTDGETARRELLRLDSAQGVLTALSERAEVRNTRTPSRL